MPEAEAGTTAPALDSPSLEGGADVQHVDATVTESANPTEAFDWTPYAEHQVTIKVNGEDQAISLKEAMSGYSRQADYTKKSQELAERASNLDYYEALGAALDRNPEGTIAYLQEQYGLSAAEATELAEELDPEAQRWDRVEGFISQQEQQQRDAAVQHELAAVKTRFADIDESSLLKHAIDTNLPLMAAAKDMLFDGVYADAEATRQARAAREAADAQATEAKRAAAGLIGGGHSVSAGAVVPGTSDKPTSFRDAFAAAKRQHGAP